MEYKWLAPLIPGDTIDIIAPGSACTQEDIAEAMLFIRALGYNPRVPYNLLGKGPPYHSQSDDIRVEHLSNALNAPDSKAIWCLRGGYGSARLLPYLQKMTPPPQPKWLVGFSDITAIHLFLLKQWQWPTLHAPVLYQLVHKKISDESMQTTLDLLSGQRPSITYSLIEPLNAAAKGHDTIRASITGGNLSLVQTSLGTFWQIDATDRILFLEECDERGYRVDRSLVHLAQAGALKGVKAVLIGECESPSHADNETSNIAYAIQRFADDCGEIPVLRIKAIGHGMVNNPLPLGIPCTLTIGMDATLEFHFKDEAWAKYA